VIRVRCSRGWTSVNGRDGSVLLVPVVGEARTGLASGSMSSAASLASGTMGSPSLSQGGSFTRRPSRELFVSES